MALTRDRFSPLTWYVKVFLTALIVSAAGLVTAGIKFAWDYKLDSNRFVADSVRRSINPIELHSVDSLLREISIKQSILLQRAP